VTNGQELIASRCRLNTYDHRAVQMLLWNSLPDELRNLACGFDSYTQFLKTILFSLS